jgi:MinD-like ATPase involved in chromosome partitioning or flagellar assembly
VKAGIIGPDRLRVLVEAQVDWLDVQWGTDDVRSAMSRIRSAEHLDAVVIFGAIQFITTDVIGVCQTNGLPIYVLADEESNRQWLDSIEGVTVITQLAEARPRIMPVDRPADGEKSPPDTDRKPSTAFIRPDGQLVAVWGSVGSPGATSLAISLSVSAAQAGLRVLLCDADTRGSSISVALGIVDDIPGLAAASRLAHRGELTEAEIERLVHTVRRGKTSVDVLTGIPRASRWAEITPSKSRPVVALAREMYDLVVVDVGFGIEDNEWVDAAPQRDGAARMFIADADLVVAVGCADVTGISRLIRGLDDVTELNGEIVVVINKSNRQSAREATDAIQRFTNHFVSVTVPRDGRGGIEDAWARGHATAGQLFELVRERCNLPTQRGR